jgi:hypothetical protein
MAIWYCNYYTCEDDAYYKPSLVEVIDIVVYDTVFSLDVSYKGKPLANDFRILALGLLVVVSTRIIYLELWLVFDEVIYLAFTDRGRVAYV